MADQRSREEATGDNAKEQVVIPVVQEQLKVDIHTVDTASVVVRKEVTEEQTTLNIPVTQEGYRVERVSVNKMVDEAPPVRQEGDVTIIPVLREVLVMQKRYEVVEEVHVIKERTTVQQTEEVTLKKEIVHVERKSLRDETPR